jgi:hypothetical protein
MAEQKFKCVIIEMPFSYMDTEKTNQDIQDVIDGKKDSCSFQCKQMGYFTWSTVRKVTDKQEDMHFQINLGARVGDVIIDHGERAVYSRYGLLRTVGFEKN